MAATSSSTRHAEPVPEKTPEAAIGPPSLAVRLRRSAPTFVVVAGLVALATWGHSSDWTMPKFSVLFGAAPEEANDWCNEHNVPESACVECNPKLMPPAKDYGWC